MTWSFFLSQLIAADRLLGDAAAAGQEEDPTSTPAKGVLAATPDQPRGDAPSGVAAPGEVIGGEDPFFAKAYPLLQTASLNEAAQLNGPSAASKPSSDDVRHGSGGGGGGGGGGGSGENGGEGSDCGKPGSGCSPECDHPKHVDWPTELVPPVLGSPAPQGAPNSVSNGISADLDVSVGGINVGIDARPIDISVNAQVSLSGLLGFDVGLGSDGIFVGAEIDVGGISSIGQLGLNPIETVELTTGLELNHLLDSDLPGIDALLGSGEPLSHIKATLAEVTGLSLVSGPDALMDQLGGGSDGVLSATLAHPTETLLSASPVPIHVVSDLANLGSDSGRSIVGWRHCFSCGAGRHRCAADRRPLCRHAIHRLQLGPAVQCSIEHRNDFLHSR